MLKNEAFKWVISLVILIILVFSFYWQQLRPNRIIKLCAGQAIAALEESDYYDTVKYDNLYRNCLRLNGLD
ncbi:MAG: hypothetical protein V1765_01130 [bacterium]